MKNIIFGFLVVFFAFLSCRSDEDSLQRIDQILNIYIKDASGQDLLNKNKIGSYTSFTTNDVLGESDNAPVNVPLKMTPDSLFYLEYIAGAKRNADTLNSTSENKTYYSELAFAFRRQVSQNVFDTINDTLRIEYRMTPALFQVSKIYLNKQLKFTKEDGAPNSVNVVTIVK